MTRPFALLAVALALSGCMAGRYEYDYDPWLGPHGHYVGGLFDAAAHRPARSCPQVEFRGPIHDGYRAPYVAGPFCVADAGSAPR